MQDNKNLHWSHANRGGHRGPHPRDGGPHPRDGGHREHWRGGGHPGQRGSPPVEDGPPGKVQSYREWKDSQHGGPPLHDEKPPHQHQQHNDHHNNRLGRGAGYNKDRGGGYRGNRHTGMRRNNGPNNYNEPRGFHGDEQQQSRHHGDEWSQHGGGYVDRDDVSYHANQYGGPEGGYQQQPQQQHPVATDTACPQNMMEPWTGSRKRT